LKKNYDAERGAGVVTGLSGLVKHEAVCLFQGDSVGPVGHQGREEDMDGVGGNPLDLLPHRVGGHVEPRGRRRGGLSEGPADFIGCQLRAVAVGEEDGIEAPSWFAGEAVVKERLV